jgi:serine/threonine protein kinase
MVSREAERPTGVCVGENTLTAFVEGALSGDALLRVEDHLAGCSACGGIVEHALASLAATRPGAASRSSAPSTPLLLPGSRVGRYRVLAPVGPGAMGTVYAAHDPDLDRRVALKLLRANGGGDLLWARLSREAKAMARLSHPNVITVHDVGTHDAHLFIAMEFVAGGTLRAWLAQRPRGWADVLSVLVRAGRGLACAHAAGLVHRDFKPDNVLVGEDGRVRVTDFGLARALRDDQAESAPDFSLAHDLLDTTITRTGALVGTPAYMAPEQLRGEPADARADTFSFSVTLYEALYGERPYGGATVPSLRSETASGVVRPAPPGSAVPARVREVLLEGLRPRADDRPPSLETLLDALEGVAIHDPPESPRRAGIAPALRPDSLADTLPPLTDSPPRRRGQGKPIWALAAGAAVVLAGLALRAQARAPRPEAPSDVEPRLVQAIPTVPTTAIPATLEAIPPSPPTALSLAPPGPTVLPKRRLPSAAVRTAPSAAVADAVALAPPPAAVPSPPSPPAAPTRSPPLGGEATNDRE